MKFLNAGHKNLLHLLSFSPVNGVLIDSGSWYCEIDDLQKFGFIRKAEYDQSDLRGECFTERWFITDLGQLYLQHSTLPLPEIID